MSEQEISNCQVTMSEQEISNCQEAISEQEISNCQVTMPDREDPWTYIYMYICKVLTKISHCQVTMSDRENPLTYIYISVKSLGRSPIVRLQCLIGKIHRPTYTYICKVLRKISHCQVTMSEAEGVGRRNNV